MLEPYFLERFHQLVFFRHLLKIFRIGKMVSSFCFEKLAKFLYGFIFVAEILEILLRGSAENVGSLLKFRENSLVRRALELSDVSDASPLVEENVKVFYSVEKQLQVRFQVETWIL